MKYPTAPLNLSNEDFWNAMQFDIQKNYFSHIVYCKSLANGSFDAIPSQNNYEWVKYHLEQGYPNDDTAVHLGRYGNVKRIWKDIHAITPLSPKVLSDRKDFGMTNGITIPIQDRLCQNRAWFTLGGKISDKEILELYYLPDLDNYFKKIHINCCINSLMKKTALGKTACHVIVLADYTDSIREIAESVGVASTVAAEILAEAYRNRSINNVDLWNAA